jgi:hypothetical protein
MITSTLIQGTDITAPEKVFTASSTGGSIIGSVKAQTSAITTIILCNVATPVIDDETANAALVNIHLVKKGQSVSTTNRIVSRLPIPAGETVFFNDERIILDGGDEIYVGSNTSQFVAVTVSSLPV